MKLLFLFYILISLITVVFSHGITLMNRGLAVLIAGGIIMVLFVLYLRVFSVATRGVLILIAFVAVILLLAYPMFSYDVFNYILTAKLTYFWKENPYLVMPIEIPNESNLAFTRAANKLALYGPTWIAASFLPSLVGFGNVWLSIIAFKIFVGAWYAVFLWMIYRYTKSLWNIIFFAFNPLILSEVLINGHNDIVMMVLAIAGLIFVRRKGTRNLVLGMVSFVASILVKGATVVLLPLFFLNWPIEKVWKAGFWLMFGVFLLTPLREELYPWYAVWFLTFAALLRPEKAKFIHEFSIALSLGLLLRHLPYVATREYGGSGPLWRMILTVLPVVMYFSWKGMKKYT